MDVKHRRYSGVGAIEPSAQGAVEELVRKIVQPKVPLIRHLFASTLHQQQPSRKKTVLRAALSCRKHPLLSIWQDPIKAASSEAGYIPWMNLRRWGVYLGVYSAICKASNRDQQRAFPFRSLDTLRETDVLERISSKH